MKYLVAVLVSLLSVWLFYFLVAAFFVQFESFPIILIWLANIILFLLSKNVRHVLSRFFFLIAIETLVPPLAAFLYTLGGEQIPDAVTDDKTFPRRHVKALRGRQEQVGIGLRVSDLVAGDDRYPVRHTKLVERGTRCFSLPLVAMAHGTCRADSAASSSRAPGRGRI